MFDLNEIVRPCILALEPYYSARDEFSGTTGVFLDANENPFGTLNRYPDPYQIMLKQKISALKQVPTDNIFIGNGSDEVVDLVYRIFCDPGIDAALTFTPTYGMYKVSAAINDVELIEVPLKSDFQIDMGQIDVYLDNTALKVIFICSPNNPTGNSFNQTDIEYILNRFKGIVFIDEAYIDFSSKESWLKTIEDYPNLIISQTFSKAWGLAGARVGTAFASKAIIQLFNKVKPPYNVSQLNQQAVIAALSDIEIFNKNKASILAEKERLADALSQLDMVRKIYPSDANFYLVEVNNANKAYQELIRLNIIVRNRTSVVENCIRITVGTPDENRQLIQALQTIAL